MYGAAFAGCRSHAFKVTFAFFGFFVFFFVSVFSKLFCQVDNTLMCFEFAEGVFYTIQINILSTI